MKAKLNKAVLESNPEITNLLVLPELDKLENTEKSISIKEFRQFGYLQELNRLFLHPLGLSLVVKVSEDGEEALEYVADYRNEGISFDKDLMETQEFKTRIKNVQGELNKRKYYS